MNDFERPNGTDDALEHSRRWFAMQSAIAGIANAIELCEAAGLRDCASQLRVVHRDAERERGRV